MDVSMHLERFLEPQKTAYPRALEEVRSGRKTGHWMWYIFPQLQGLGQSSMACYYGIANLQEARAYLEHPVLGQRLYEITQALLDQPEQDPIKIFGWPDNLKLRSCMTLFAQVSENSLFTQALQRFFDGQEDFITLELLKKTSFK